MHDQFKRRRSGMAISIFTLLLIPLSLADGASDQKEAYPVANHMKVINQSFRELRRHIDDPSSAEANLARIEEMKQQLLAARKDRPLKTEDLAESERASFLEDYQSRLDEVVATLGKLEAAIKQNRQDEAKALVKELNRLKKEGHSKFQKE